MALCLADADSEPCRVVVVAEADVAVVSAAVGRFVEVVRKGQIVSARSNSLGELVRRCLLLPGPWCSDCPAGHLVGGEVVDSRSVDA